SLRLGAPLRRCRRPGGSRAAGGHRAASGGPVARRGPRPLPARALGRAAAARRDRARADLASVAHRGGRGGLDDPLPPARDALGVSIIYITHDLATAYYVADRIIIMRKGEVVERGDAAEVLRAPRHPYSILLKDSVLSIDGANGRDANPSHATT